MPFITLSCLVCSVNIAMSSKQSALRSFQNLFKCERSAIIGMVHCKALPGTPKNTLSLQELTEQVKYEAEIYRRAGVDGVMLENMHDIPYVIQSKDHQPEITAAMTSLSVAVRGVLGQAFPLGCQILAGGNREALAVSAAAGLNFIRVEGFIFGHLADEGYMDACAGQLMRYRNNIRASDVLVWADIKKKHSSHAITSDVSVSDTAKAAEFCMADGVIITGGATGEEAGRKQLEEVQSAVPSLPTLVGSGITLDNVQDYMSAQGMVIGSYFKEGGRWDGELSYDKTAEFMDLVKRWR